MKKKLFLFIFLFFISISSVCAKEKEKVIFSKCVDGDTIKVLIDGEEKTVRFLAVDTPETVNTKTGIEYYGKEASNYTCNMVTNANILELEYDSNSDKTDKYDRLLAWIFVDDTLLQELLISGGYAKVAYLYGDYKYTSVLQELEINTKKVQIGIWDDVARAKFENKDFELSWQDIIIILGIVVITIITGKNKSIKKIVNKIKKVGKI